MSLSDLTTSHHDHVPRSVEHANYLATRHFGSLDGLRFLCITAVIWHHLPLWRELSDGFILFARGHVGVDFFFVLSGYLITTLLLREETTKGRFSLRAFYWRRFLRIIPVYYFVVTIAALFSIVLQGRTEDAQILPYYYLFMSNFLATEEIAFLGPTWSLAMEEQFYLVWPLLLLLVPRRWILKVLGILVLQNLLSAMGVFGLIGITGFSSGPLYFSISATTYAPLFMGAALAVVLNSRTGFANAYKFTGFQGAAVFWFLVVIATLIVPKGALEGLPNLFVHLSMTMMLASLVVREDNTLAPVMSLGWISRIGQISYGIYLYHLFALALVGGSFEMMGWTNLWLVGVTYYALAIAIAELSFRTIEAWPMRFRKRGWGHLGGLDSR